MDDKMNAILKGIQQLQMEHTEILQEVRELKAASISDQQANQVWRKQMAEEVNGITRNQEVNEHRCVQYAFVAGLAKYHFVHTLQGLPKLYHDMSIWAGIEKSFWIFQSLPSLSHPPLPTQLQADVEI